MAFVGSKPHRIMGKLLQVIRQLAASLGIAFLVLMPACSFHSQPAVLPTVGPAPARASAPEADGFLVVYSAWSNFVDQGSTGHHSRYIVSSEDGRTRREVINHIDRFDEGPIRLPLASGGYRVSARSARFGRVTVPVVIQPRQTTSVYLDGSSHPQVHADQGSEVVRLPDGEVVGWSTMVSGNGTR
jgi:hypothetical protein